LKKSLNEAQTDWELFLKYLEQEHDGILDCQLRQYNQVETKLRNEIEYLETQMEKEKLVNDQITRFLSKRRTSLENEGDKWDNKKQEETDKLVEEHAKFTEKKDDDEKKKEETLAALQQE